MNFRVVTVAIMLVFLLAFSFAATTHCFRQDISRSVSHSDAHSGVICANCGGYDYIFHPGGKFKVQGINNFEYVCDNGVSGYAKNFVSLWKNSYLGNLLATNAPQNSGPRNVGPNYCMRGNFICYKKGNTLYPGEGKCDYGSLDVGSGSSSGISYSFQSSDIGEKDIYMAYGKISPAGVSPYSGAISYGLLEQYKIFVGNPSLLVFGQEERHLTATSDNQGQHTEEVFFTLLNKSHLTDKIVDYEINCGNSEEVTCTIDEGYEGYVIGPAQGMFIRGEVTVEGDNIPIEFPVSLDVEYEVVNDAGERLIDNCPGAEDDEDGVEDEGVISCEVNSEASIFQIGLLDEQDFQVEMKGSEEQDYCIGPNGMFGQTGQEFAPRVNLEFGGGEGAGGKIIQLDECDAEALSLKESDSGDELLYEPAGENDDWVYCSQKEFLVELAAKIEKIAEIREKISGLTGFERNQDMIDELRKSEGILGTFEANLRAQPFDDDSIEDAVDGLGEIESEMMFGDIGLGEKFPDTERTERIEDLFVNGTTFGSEMVQPGRYQVTIDMNDLVAEGLIERGEEGFAELLFPDGQVNQALQINVSFEKQKGYPRSDWFFYENGEQEIGDNFVEMHEAGMQETNMGERGIILEYSETSSDQNKLYSTYAVPLFAKISSDSNGEATTSFDISGEAATDYYGEDISAFTQWSGFASTEGEGCSTIAKESADSEAEAIPYRLPDTKQSENGEIDFSIFESGQHMVPDGEMFLDTVLFVPTNQGSGKAIDLNWHAPNSLYTVAGQCGESCKLRFDRTEASYAIPRESVLQVIFDGINDETVCVHQNVRAQGSKWTLFWNTKKILAELDDEKVSALDNSDAVECSARKVGGNPS